MRYLILLLALFFFLLTCKKEHPDNEKSYPLHIKFSRLKTPGTKLVISDSQTGEVLDYIDLPLDTQIYIGAFNVVESVIVDTIDLHIISPAYDFLSFSIPTNIETYSSVPIGSFVDFSPFENFTKAYKTYLYISGIDNFDTLTAGHIRPGKVVYDPNEKSIFTEVFLGPSYGCILRVMANNESDFRYFYLPDSLTGDTVHLKWDDFKQETSLRSIILPPGLKSNVYRVDAVSPDFTKAISVGLNNSGSSFTPTFNLPPILPDDWLLYVKMNIQGRNCAHIYAQNEPITIHFPELKLETFSASEQQLTVSTSGDVDWITIIGEGDFYWEINGSTDAFKKIAIPDLSPFLDPALKQSSIEWNQYLLKKLDLHNAEEIRAGIPYQGPGFFPLARSGYHDIWSFR